MSRTRHPRPARKVAWYYSERIAYLVRRSAVPIVRRDRVVAKETPKRILAEPEPREPDMECDEDFPLVDIEQAS